MEKHICPWWFGYTFDNPLRPLVHPPHDVLGDLVETGQTAADVGCGGGHFTLGLARLVGAEGKVIAVDLQEKMLARTRARAKRLGLGQVIDFRTCTKDHLGLKEPLDFALAFWMAHEVVDPRKLFSEIAAVLRPSGRLLLAEPRVHVTGSKFRGIVEAAAESGFEAISRPKVRFSRAILFSPVVSGKPGES